MNHLRIYILLLFAFLANLPLKGNDFVIEDYHIEAKINRNGSVYVKEKIFVKFIEARRGIIRSIPFRYRVENIVQGRKALRNQSGLYYHTLIKDIKVSDHPFIQYEEGNNIFIRIGDPNKTQKGRVEYEISYTLWGVLNDFEEWVEFPFNIIGHEWSAPIENASFSIQLPVSYQIPIDDLLGYSGYFNSKEANLKLTSKAGIIEGRITKSLNPYQGVTVSMKIPRKYFDNTQIPMEELTDDYYVTSQKTVFSIYPDSKIEVKEIIEIVCLQPQYYLEKIIKNKPFEDDIQQYIYPKAFFAMDMKKNTPLDLNIRRTGDADILTLQSKSGSFNGKVTLEIDYELYGNFIQDTIGQHLFVGHLPFGVMNHKAPVEDISFEIRYITTSPATALSGSSVFMKPEHTFEIKSEKQKVVKYIKQGAALFGFEDFAQVFLVADDFSISKMPYQVFARNYSILNNEIYLSVKDNSAVSAQQTLEVDWMYNRGGSDFEWNYKRHYKDFLTKDTSNITFPSYNLFSNYTLIAPTFEKLDTSLSAKNYWENGVITLKPGRVIREPFVELSYSIPGLQFKEDNQWRIHIPIVHNNREPILRTTIQLDTNYFNKNNDFKLFDQEGNTIPFEFSGHQKLIVNEMISPGNTVYLSALMKEDAIRNNLAQKAGIYLNNHIYIFYSLLIILFLLVLWAIFGRDRKPLIMARFYPPEGLTPAEIGWLYDDKIHNRDMISLIYYWAANGCLEIEEIEGKSRFSKKKDYILRKLDNLTDDAQDFEHTLFNGLFGKKKQVTISDLKNKFYTHIDKSKKQLEKHGRQNEFYIPGTRGFGSCLVVIAFILSVCTVFFGVFGFFSEDQSMTVGILILAIAFFIIGSIMPKKGQLGFKKYEKLLGFKEFIEKAEMDRLRLLIDDDPKYFERTIPYAVAFGLADEWSEKFSEILIRPPSWYKSSDMSGGFNAYLLTTGIERSIKDMTSTLTSRPASSGSSSGSGGSSFGGGFSSGGGFGGGGGSSW